jgi:hypothetical protein
MSINNLFEVKSFIKLFYTEKNLYFQYRISIRKMRMLEMLFPFIRKYRNVKRSFTRCLYRRLSLVVKINENVYISSSHFQEFYHRSVRSEQLTD